MIKEGMNCAWLGRVALLWAVGFSLPGWAFAGVLPEGVPIEAAGAPGAAPVVGIPAANAAASGKVGTGWALGTQRRFQGRSGFKRLFIPSPPAGRLAGTSGSTPLTTRPLVPRGEELAEPSKELATVGSPQVPIGEAKAIVDADWQRRVEGKDGGLRVWVTASEAVPFLKTGGLADVTDALSRHIASSGHRVTLVLPRYKGLNLAGLPRPQRLPGVLRVPVGGREEAAALWRTRHGPLDVLLVQHDYFFNREGAYDSAYGPHGDNDQRFRFFAHAALEAARYLGEPPDIVHAHDWMTALVPALLASEYASDPFFARTASVLTVHNVAYQGGFGPRNYLREGLAAADKLTTVSRTYAQEVRTAAFGHGMEELLRERAGDFTGIVNGIDPAVWDPRSDPELFRPYGPGDWKSGKAANKLALQKLAGLPAAADAPLFGVAARLDPQKGLDLVAAAAPLLKKYGAQLVVVGSGSRELAELFQSLMREFPATVSARTVFDERFARRLYAASDFYLMPSRFEPCGLSQLIAMRYGSVPIASPTGGLLDTVSDAGGGPGKGTGYVLSDGSQTALEAAILRALRQWGAPAHETLVRNGMARDSSWALPARQYLEVYRRALIKKGTLYPDPPLVNERREHYPEIGVGLGDGMVVEGSKGAGGTQNDFLIDYRDQDLWRRIVLPARAIGASEADVWTKIRRVIALVNAEMPRDGIRRRTYHQLNASALGFHSVSLGSYLRARTGVCRENAVLTALALREAGFDARFGYFGVYASDAAYDEDHGTALVDVDGVTYIVDSFRPYARYYNGHRLADLLHPPEDGRYPHASPLAARNDRDPGRWRLEPHPFPTVRKAPDAEAASLLQELVRDADKSLDARPNPLPDLESGLDPEIQDQRGAVKKEANKAKVLAYAYAVTGKAAYAESAKRFILAWARLYRPSGRPLDDSKLTGLFLAYDKTRGAFSAREQTEVESWMRAIARAEIENQDRTNPTVWNNWNSHRLWVTGAIGFVLGDKGIVEYTLDRYRRHVERNLQADGSSLDFHQRDALAYHCFDLKPLLALAVLASRRGIDLYHYQGANGASLQKAVGFLVPYAEGTQTHAEWVHTRVKHDRERIRLGQLTEGELFRPERAKDILARAVLFDPDLLPLVGRLAGKPSSRYPTLDVLLDRLDPSTGS